MKKLLLVMLVCAAVRALPVMANNPVPVTIIEGNPPTGVSVQQEGTDVNVIFRQTSVKITGVDKVRTNDCKLISTQNGSVLVMAYGKHPEGHPGDCLVIISFDPSMNTIKSVVDWRPRDSNIQFWGESVNGASIVFHFKTGYRAFFIWTAFEATFDHNGNPTWRCSPSKKSKEPNFGDRTINIAEADKWVHTSSDKERKDTYVVCLRSAKNLDHKFVPPRPSDPSEVGNPDATEPH
jgi:hypothetical protein